jgi:hypothetical protein
MERLRQQVSSSDPALANAARRLSRVPPLEPSLRLKHRVRASLALRRRRGTKRLLRLALIGATVFGFGAIGFAAVDRGWIRALVFEPAPPPAPHARSLPRAPSSPKAEEPAAPSLLARIQESTSVHAPIEPEKPQQKRAVRALVAEDPAPLPQARGPLKAPPPEAAANAAPLTAQERIAPVVPERGSELVLEALRALRQDGDPKRARARLDEYLAAHPSGALVEEASALEIEAAAAEDDPQTVDLARRYLDRYPTGRFRDAALRARERFRR